MEVPPKVNCDKCNKTIHKLPVKGFDLYRGKSDQDYPVDWNLLDSSLTKGPVAFYRSYETMRLRYNTFGLALK